MQAGLSLLPVSMSINFNHYPNMVTATLPWLFSAPVNRHSQSQLEVWRRWFVCQRRTRRHAWVRQSICRMQRQRFNSLNSPTSRRCDQIISSGVNLQIRQSFILVLPCCSFYKWVRLVHVLLPCPRCYPFPLLPISSVLPPPVSLLLSYTPLRSPPISGLVNAKIKYE